ncbi:hypothetical protein OROHE_001175 [Orobanche hederae]
MSSSDIHILEFPFPAQGHMLPLLNLTHQLSLRGLSITILITPKNIPLLTPLLSSSPSIQSLILPSPTTLPSLPAARTSKTSTTMATSQSWPLSVNSMIPSSSGWTHHLATRLRIPRIVFYCSGAFVVSIFNHIMANFDSLKSEIDVIKFDDLPRTPSFSWDQLPSLFRRCKDLECRDKTEADFIKTSMEANALSWASVFNSFWALEDQFLEFLGSRKGHSKVYSVGPVNMVNGPAQLRVGDTKADSNNGVISWLDGCDDGSILYVCFGSQKLLTTAQVGALATGLETSQVRFIWVVKPLSTQQVEDGYRSVPGGFEDWVSCQGLALKGWAPQTAILSHRAVGGFLSHCGWNSILEAMTAGVLILAWPMEADQFGNAKLVVVYKDAAVLVCEGVDTVLDSAELARKISESMDGSTTRRNKAKDFKKQALEAVKGGGSSITDLDRLAKELSKL